jgi:hypothetical protein
MTRCHDVSCPGLVQVGLIVKVLPVTGRGTNRRRREEHLEEGASAPPQVFLPTTWGVRAPSKLRPSCQL